MNTQMMQTLQICFVLSVAVAFILIAIDAFEIVETQFVQDATVVVRIPIFKPIKFLMELVE